MNFLMLFQLNNLKKLIIILYEQYVKLENNSEIKPFFKKANLKTVS